MTCEGISGRCPLAQGAPELLAEHTRMPWAAAGGACAALCCAALRCGRCSPVQPEKNSTRDVCATSIACPPQRARLY